jgi:YggT family protein
MLEFAILILSMYLFVLSFAIILSWFGRDYGRFGDILRSLTRPYLDFFRRYTPIRLGHLDLSVLVGFAAIYFVLRILEAVRWYGAISLGLVLGVLLVTIWGIIQTAITLLVILMIIRFITLYARPKPGSQLVLFLDNVLSPILAWVKDRLFRNRAIQARGLLLVTALILVGVAVAGTLGVETLLPVLFGLGI